MPKMLMPVDTPKLTGVITSEVLGAFVRARRTQLGLRIEDAAALCGVAKDTLMKLEHGRPKVQLGSALLICKGLGIQLEVISWENKNDEDVWV